MCENLCKSAYLVTTLTEDAQSCADRYQSRYDVETDIKYIKVAMGTENITAKSKEMVMNELYTSLTAFNLVEQFRRQAADMSGVPPRRLSFNSPALPLATLSFSFCQETDRPSQLQKSQASELDVSNSLACASCL